MVIVGLVILNLLILNVRLRITRTTWKQPQKIQKRRLPVLLGVCSAGALLLYPHLLELASLEQIKFSTDLTISRAVVGVLLGYLVIILLINSLITTRLTPQQTWLKHMFLFLVVVGTLYLFGSRFSRSSLIIYYLLVAGSEEFLKYLSGEKLQSVIGYASQDIILLCILVALGFAFFENSIYLIETVSAQLNRQSQLTIGGGLLISRGLMGFLVHLLFTGLIAVSSLHAYKTKNITWLIVGILGGLALHLTYNLLLTHNYPFFLLAYLIGGYVFLSWLFYTSDRLYLSS